MDHALTIVLHNTPLNLFGFDRRLAFVSRARIRVVARCLALAFAFFLEGFALAGDLPDARLTPGAVNPDVTQDNISKTICVKGYTKSIRPTASFTNRLKKQQLKAYGYADRNPKHYEEDHLIALSIGGAPVDARNLWPEPRGGEWGAGRKDELEYVLYKKVCAHELSLAQAQRELAEDWIAAWRRHASGRRVQRSLRVD